MMTKIDSKYNAKNVKVFATNLAQLPEKFLEKGINSKSEVR
jgi:hypothetical protein